MRIILPPYAQNPETGEALPPHRQQVAFHNLDSKYKYFRGGIGSGKSHAGAQEFITGILRNYAHFCRLPLNKRAGGLEYHCGAPTYQLIDAGPWTHLCRLLEEIEIKSGFSLEKRRWIAHPRKIELITGDVIKFVTLPGKFAGAQSAGFWIDEAELMDSPVEGFQVLNNRLRDHRAIRPFGIITSSPKGNRGLSAFFNSKIAEGDPAFGQIVAKTTDNPIYQGSDYVDSLRSTMSEREIRENLGGEIIGDESSVYALDFDNAESLNWRWNYDRHKPDCEYNLAIDPGGNSWHALLIEYNRQTDTDTVFDEVAMEHCQPEAFFRAIQNQCKAQWGLAWQDINTVYIDEHPKDVRFLSYKFWKGKVVHRRVKDRFAKLSGINCVRWRLKDGQGRRRLLFAPRLRTIKSPRRILQAMTQYHWCERRVDDFMVQTTRTDGASPFSHAADCLRYAMWIKHGHKRVFDLEVAA